MSHYLTSPGEALVERLELEREALAQARSVLDEFLLGVVEDALDDSVLTLGASLRRWTEVVEKLTGPLSLREQSVRRLLASSIPALAFDTVTAVLGEGRENRRDADTLRVELTAAMHPDTGSVRRTAGEGLEAVGMNWQSVLDRDMRTEVTASAAATRLEKMGPSGFAQKQWVAHHDATTRASHLVADGQTVAVSVPFVVGGFSLMFPADPAAPLSETLNCRCVVVAAGPVSSEVDYAQYHRELLKAGPTRVNTKAEANTLMKTLRPAGMRSTVISKNYAGTPASFHINKSLRTGDRSALAEISKTDVETKDVAGAIEQMRADVRKNPLAESVMVYRGLSAVDKVLGEESLAGATLTDKAFMSTSLVKDYVVGWMKEGTGQRAMLEIIVPKGTPAAVIGGSESEVILPDGTQLRIVADEPSFVQVGKLRLKYRKLTAYVEKVTSL